MQNFDRCIFDFVIVCVSWVDVVVGVLATDGSSAVNVLFLRLVRFVRVFRILKGATKFYSSRIILETIFKGFYNSRYVFVFICFFVVLSSTLGLTWFREELRFRCALTSGTDADGVPFSLTPDEIFRLGVLAEEWELVTSAPQLLTQPEGFCRHRSKPLQSWGRQCAENEGQLCVRVGWPPFSSVLNFEHFGNATICVLLTMLQQDYERLMLGIMQATSQAACIYFIVIVVVGGLFLMNYATAVMCLAYVEVKKKSESNVAGDDAIEKEQEALLLQVCVRFCVHFYGHRNVHW